MRYEDKEEYLQRVAEEIESEYLEEKYKDGIFKKFWRKFKYLFGLF